MSKWTKGPWRVESRPGWGKEPLYSINFGTPRDDLYHLRIADIMSWPKGHTGPKGNPTNAQAKANAHLIAAAPDMAEALEAICDALQASIDNTGPSSAELFAVSRARAALAKAKGEGDD